MMGTGFRPGRQDWDALWAKRTTVAKTPDTAVYASGSIATRVRLRRLSRMKNRITDTAAWMDANDLAAASQTPPDGFPARLGDVPFVVTLPDASLPEFAPARLGLYGTSPIEPRYLAAEDFVWDFGRFFRAGKFTWILAAAGDSSTIYVATGTNGYASEVANKKGFLSAFERKSGKLLWQTPPLCAAAGSFVVLKDAIVCGYGFTAEPDFLFVIDKKTGRIAQKLSVPTGPEYIVHRDKKIAVRCYDTDEVYEIRG